MLEGIGEKHHTVRLLMNLRLIQDSVCRSNKQTSCTDIYHNRTMVVSATVKIKKFYTVCSFSYVVFTDFTKHTQTKVVTYLLQR